jgi:PIN like domain
MAEGSVTFLFDANLPSGLAEALGVLGESAQHVSEIFAPGTPDETWIRYAGERNWCIVTRDVNIGRRHHELAALRDFSVGAFFLLPGKRSPNLCQIIQTVIRHWPEMKRLARTEPRPFQYEVRERGVNRIR